MKTLLSIQLSFILLLLVLVLGVTGCPQQQQSIENFGGLSATFVSNAPPLNVIINQAFPIYVDINNLGDANVNTNSAKFYLSGIGKNLEGVKASLSNTNLLDKGSSERLDFASAAKSTLELSNPFTLAMLLTSCYKYGGKAQADICIASSNSSKICSISGNKLNSNSAEPIQITSVTEEISGSNLVVSFIISNKGTGEVYLPDSDCDKLQARDINEVLKNGKVKVSIRTPEDFKCKVQSLVAPYSTIETLEGASSLGTVSCEKSILGESDHQAPFQVVLDYVYVGSISQSLVITPS